MRKIILGLLLAVGALTAHAQNSKDSTLDINCEPESEDRIGTVLCSSLRDSVVTSVRYHSGRPSDPTKPYWTLRVVTVSVLTTALPTPPSAIALTLTLEMPMGGSSRTSIFITTWVQTVSTLERVKRATSDIMSVTDNEIERVRKGSGGRL